MDALDKDNRYSSAAIVISGLLLSLWLVLFAGGMTRYPGSCALYALFSFAFLAMLISGVVRQIGYGYLFLVVMLWLGFWLKVTVHLIFPYPFTEFTGRFVSSQESWDEVLTVATFAAAGVLAARLMIPALGASLFRRNMDQKPAVPDWYRTQRTRLWTILLVSITTIAALNAIYGFQQSGLVPRHILGWHLNGLIYYLLFVVFAICCATLIWWDIQSDKSVAGTVYAILYESVVSSISLLSRGTLVFHAVPQLVALYRHRLRLKGFTLRKAMMLLLVLVISVMATYSVVNSLRNYYYSNAPLDLSVESFAEGGRGGSGGSNGFLRFAVDRWLGVEGVMAVAAHPDKGGEQFWRALTERAEGGVTMYQEICLSHYRNMDTSKFHFANLPGAVGFFLYSGSLAAVFAGLMIFTVAVLSIEVWTFNVTGNPLLCAYVGGGLANTVCQFGVAPSNLLPFFLALGGAIFVVGALQSGGSAKSLR